MHHLCAVPEAQSIFEYLDGIGRPLERIDFRFHRSLCRRPRTVRPQRAPSGLGKDV
jgi:hypothetical protein